MRVLLTGGTGSLGGAVARRLRERGDDVRALVRVPDRAEELRELGCRLVEGDLSDEGALVRHCEGVDAVVHAASLCELGAPEARRSEMVDTNVCGTERMLGAALTAGVGKAVHVSTLVVLGDTGGQVADEAWVRDPAVPFTSVYERTKTIGHGRAHEIGARGLPLVAVQPGAVYAAGRRSTLDRLADRFLGGRLQVMPFPDAGLCPVHLDDVADGVVLALDKGVPGSSYVLAGEPVRVRQVLAVLAELTGRRAPVLPLPTTLLRALAPVGPLVGPVLGLPPNLRELISSSHGVTFWASSAKAMDELGWTCRPLRQGLAELVAAR